MKVKVEGCFDPYCQGKCGMPYFPDADDLFRQTELGIMGGYSGQAECSHQELSQEEFVETCVGLFGGSWQDLWEKLSRKGIKIIRV